MELDTDGLIHLLETGNNVFLTGGGGVGKSYQTRKIIRHFRDSGKGVVALGSTGVSAINIGGQTVHSFFALGVSKSIQELRSNAYRYGTSTKKFKAICKTTSLIIIDEISMISSSTIEMIDYRLKQARYKGVLLLVGDFYQLPPVLKDRSNYMSNKDVFAFESSIWKSWRLVVVTLTKMQRTKDMVFARILNFIRTGDANEEVLTFLTKLTENQNVHKDATFLFATNSEADKMNDEKLSKLEGVEYRIVAECRLLNKKLNPNEISSWKQNLTTPEVLVIKVGAPVLFTVNKWNEYVNGDRGIVEKIDDDVIYIRKGNKTIALERNNFSLEKSRILNGEYSKNVEYVMSQFPIKLGYAITIHKSQGMSIDNLVCDVVGIFLPSQFYVAISRAKDPKSLKLEIGNEDPKSCFGRIIYTDPKVVRYYSKPY